MAQTNEVASVKITPVATAIELRVGRLSIKLNIAPEELDEVARRAKEIGVDANKAVLKYVALRQYLPRKVALKYVIPTPLEEKIVEQMVFDLEACTSYGIYAHKLYADTLKLYGKIFYYLTRLNAIYAKTLSKLLNNWEYVKQH
jgi:hypothetical protein